MWCYCLWAPMKFCWALFDQLMCFKTIRMFVVEFALDEETSLALYRLLGCCSDKGIKGREDELKKRQKMEEEMRAFVEGDDSQGAQQHERLDAAAPSARHDQRPLIERTPSRQPPVSLTQGGARYTQPTLSQSRDEPPSSPGHFTGRRVDLISGEIIHDMQHSAGSMV